MTPTELAELRRTPYAAARPVTKAEDAQRALRSYYERDADVRTYVLARAEGVCEACGASAPFERSSGEPYLEPHHIRRLADDGPDQPAWMAAIFPNCHRRIHHGKDGKAWNERLLEKIKEMEGRLETAEATVRRPKRAEAA